MLKRFKVVIEPDLDAGGFTAHVPALPGCCSEGETLGEALSNIKEALELFIWSLKDDGLPIPDSNATVEVREVEISV